MVPSYVFNPAFYILYLTITFFRVAMLECFSKFVFSMNY